uniref:Uncharacterized protein n=1 Tax=Parascaris univalens TaxID=6257 RepID=A0A915AI92_PARUN
MFASSAASGLAVGQVSMPAIPMPHCAFLALIRAAAAGDTASRPALVLAPLRAVWATRQVVRRVQNHGSGKSEEVVPARPTGVGSAVEQVDQACLPRASRRWQVFGLFRGVVPALRHMVLARLRGGSGRPDSRWFWRVEQVVLACSAGASGVIGMWFRMSKRWFRAMPGGGSGVSAECSGAIPPAGDSEDSHSMVWYTWQVIWVSGSWFRLVEPGGSGVLCQGSGLVWQCLVCWEWFRISGHGSGTLEEVVYAAGSGEVYSIVPPSGSGRSAVMVLGVTGRWFQPSPGR